MPFSVNIIRLLEKVESPLKEVLIEILAEIEKQRRQWEESVTKTEFNELKDIVAELVKAQKRTEQKVAELADAQRNTEQKVAELGDAQKNTEQRVARLEETAQKLINAQRDAERRLTRLENTVQGLIDAQKDAERRLTRLENIVQGLIEAQRDAERRLTRLENTVQGLIEAQKRTEEELRKLAAEHRKTREQLGGLAHTVGYALEDRAFETLPSLLQKEFGIEVKELKRDFIEISPNKYEEINIIGQGKKSGTPIWIIGECKTQIKKRDVDSFLKRLSRVEHLFPGERLFVIVTYQASPQIREYIKEKGLKLYFSYELRRNPYH